MHKLVILLSSCFIFNITTAQNLFDIVSDSKEHTILEDLLLFTGLDSLLTNGDYYTLLAPRDDAFLAVLSQEVIDSMKVEAKEELEFLVLSHITKDTIDISENDVFGQEFISLANKGFTFFIDASGNILVASLATAIPYVDQYAGMVNADNGGFLPLLNGIMDLKDLPSISFLPQDHIMSEYMYISGFTNMLTIDSSQITLVVPDSDSIKTTQFFVEGGFEIVERRDSFLRAHIIDGRYPLHELSDGQKLINWNNDELTVTLVGEKYYVDGIGVANHCFNNQGALLNLEYNAQSTTYVIELSNETIQISPNPATTSIQISPTSNVSRDVWIFNADAKLVKRFVLDAGASELNVSELENGSYFLMVKNSDLISIQKFIVQK